MEFQPKSTRAPAHITRSTANPPASKARFVHGKAKLRTHTKSRFGCLNCKARKVKCQETRPACANCVKRGMPCIYPPTLLDQRPLHGDNQEFDNLSGSDVSVSKSLTHSDLNISDLRLLHHFLLYAHPHLPAGHGHVWMIDVPARAIQYPYLMHAILGLSATHLNTRNRVIPSEVALSHRQVAIRGVNDAISAGSSLKMPELDVVLAACYALTMQSSYMVDGFRDFITLLRGCGIVAVTIASSDATDKPLFALGDPSEVHSKVKHLNIEAHINPSILDSASASLEPLQVLCTGRVQMKFYALLLDSVAALRCDPCSGYTAFTKLYGLLVALGEAESKELFDNASVVPLLLQMHFLAISTVVTPITVYEAEGISEHIPIGTMISWIESMFERLGPQSVWAPFAAWPVQVAVTVREQTRNKWLSLRGLSEMVREKPQLLVLPMR